MGGAGGYASFPPCPPFNSVALQGSLPPLSRAPSLTKGRRPAEQWAPQSPCWPRGLQAPQAVGRGGLFKIVLGASALERSPQNLVTEGAARPFLNVSFTSIICGSK